MISFIRTTSTRLPNLASLLIGMLVGGLAGFGAAMLFAPQSGEKTRAQLVETSAGMQDRAAVTFDDLIILSRFDNRRILLGNRWKS